MTRINCIRVEDLLDQHLLIEYREITRVSKLARQLDNYGSYKLGPGHVKFFYNKGLYLSKRCNDLYSECIKRGFSPTKKVYRLHPEGLNLDWEPTIVDMYKNVSRLREKFEMRPTFYKYWSEPVEEAYNIEILKV